MINVSIIEDNKAFLDALKLLLADCPSINVVSCYSNTNHLLANLEKNLPHVIVMDIDLPGPLNGIAATLQIKQRHPEIQILILTVFDDENKIFDALRAGASGYLLKQDTPEEICNAIIDLHAGESKLHPQIVRKVIRFFQQLPLPTPQNDLLDDLSNREKEILNLILMGHSYQRMAELCYLSPHTVKTHIRNIFKKLQVQSRAEIAHKYRPV